MPPELPLTHALVLGALHGPAELLPVSSSGHVTLVPFLLGWDYDRLDPEVRKAFEVAVHAGTALGILVALPPAVPALRLLVGSLAPPSLIGLVLEGPIERRLGTPRSIAFGLAAGGVAMALADRCQRQHRASRDATTQDALALGLAQALALVPGLSRSGMTLSAARVRGFSRAEADALSRSVALPVILGATVLKGRHGVPRGLRARFFGAAVAAFASTLASRPLVRPERALWPYAAYRVALATAVVRRVRHTAPR